MGFEIFIYILRWVTKLIGKICDLPPAHQQSLMVMVVMVMVIMMVVIVSVVIVVMVVVIIMVMAIMRCLG
jgi:hypothetical protein